LSLASPGIRIEAPIPGKAAIGIEVPNKDVTSVLLREVIESEAFKKQKSKISFSIGKDVAGANIVADLSKMPHLLIAGSTGSGKSICINSLIASILYKATPDEVKLLLIDPKVVELSIYKNIPHLLVPVVTDPKKAAGALNWAVMEMTERYKKFAANNVRDIYGYNNINKEGIDKLPQIVVIIDELADLMMVAPGEVEDSICRLAQMARAAGIHLVVATQRPSVDVITGLIKANIPSRISFAVSSHIDSRTILDMGGAEKLLGKGDALFYPVGASKPIRVQGAFVSEKEIEKLVNFIKDQVPVSFNNEIIKEIEQRVELDEETDVDELLKDAIKIVVESGQASILMLQRRLKIGYSRAARLIDQMEERRIIGGFEGSKPRKVLVSKEDLDEMI
jgi:S-DNA-T family DNA segregation ATPase FtsK/SpoIIIE